MPLSTLKLQFLFLQFSTQATLMSSTCPLNNFLTKINYESLHKYKVGIYIKFHHVFQGKGCIPIKDICKQTPPTGQTPPCII